MDQCGFAKGLGFKIPRKHTGPVPWAVGSGLEVKIDDEAPRNLPKKPGCFERATRAPEFYWGIEGPVSLRWLWALVIPEIPLSELSSHSLFVVFCYYVGAPS